jgi:hypothetical protein
VQRQRINTRAPAKQRVLLFISCQICTYVAHAQYFDCSQGVAFSRKLTKTDHHGKRQVAAQRATAIRCGKALLIGIL